MDIIEQARQNFEADNPFWTFPLARTLETHQKGLALEWALRCVAQLLPESGTSNLTQLQNDLDNLVAWAHNQPITAVYYPELMREIWYRPGGYDPARIAMSKLYATYEFYRRGDKNYFDTAGTPISNFFVEGSAWFAKPAAFFSLVTEIYTQLLN